MTDCISEIGRIRRDQVSRFLVLFCVRLSSIARTYYLDRPADVDVESAAAALGDINELLNAASGFLASLLSDSPVTPTEIERHFKHKISHAVGSKDRLFGDANFAAGSALKALHEP